MASYAELRNKYLPGKDTANSRTSETTQKSGSGTQGSTYSSIRKQYLGSTDPTVFPESRLSRTENREGEWQDKYKGKTVNELFDAISQMEDGDEKDWLTNYTRVKDSVYRKKYQGTGYQALSDALSNMEDGEEKDWLTSYAAQVDYDEKRNLDISAYEKVIQDLQRQIDEYSYDWTDVNQRKQADAYISPLQAEVERRQQYLTQAKRIQEQEAGKKKYSEVKKNADFAQNSGFDSSNREIGYQYVNADQDRRLELEQRYGQYAENFGYNSYDSLTDEEKEIYNYYMNTGDRESAAEYLKYLQDTLNQRKGQNIYESGYEDHLLQEYIFGAEAGLDQFRSGVQGLGNMIAGRDDYVAPSAKQYASQIMREDLADDGWKLPSWLGGASLGQLGYDAITTTANMMPSILAGAAANFVLPGSGAVVSGATLGAGAGGSAYQEAVNEGYSVDQARGYGILSGASEIVMEHLLGGISAYGGNALGKFFTQNMKNADTALKRIAKEIGGSMLSEFSEEYLQEVLTPVFRNLMLGTDEEVKLVSADALYAGFLGAITGGILEGPSAIAGSRNATVDNSNATAELDNTTPVLGNTDTALEKPTPGGVTEENSATNEESPVVVAENASTEESAKKAHSTEPVTLEVLSQKYGQQAKAMEANYIEGQDLEEYDRAFQMAYDMGKAGVSAEYVRTSEATSYLSESQREIACEIGAAAATDAAKSQAGKNMAAINGKTGWRKGTVRGQDVKIADMAKAFNDPQRKAYKYLSNIAEVTGVDIVLYKSEVGQDGKYQGSTEGSFKWNEDTIYIDINAGLESYKDAESLAKYTIMRTFDHEFTHFIEKWNPEEYNGFRKTVFEVMQQSGTNVEDLIDTMLAKSGGQLTYDQASREVIAEAMTDILPETSFIETLAQKNQNVFQQLLSKLKEFLTSLRTHFASMGTGTKEAKSLKKQVGDTVSYMEEIVKKFDEVAVKAVENYQRTVAEDASVSKEEKVISKKEKTTPTKKKAAPEKKTEEAPTQEIVTKPAESGTQTPSEKLADQIVAEYLSQKKILTAKELYALADTAFGGTQAEGAYNRKDAYDAMELAVNKHLLTAAREFNGDRNTAVDAVKYMQGLLELLPTQSVRTQEQQDFQQFSTPPNIAYLAAWAANINARDSVLEPSAGIGGLAVFAKAWGAEVAVNELSKRRLEVLRAMGFDHLFNENAEQIDNILPESISPSVVIMNPPFSSTAGRTKNNKTSNAEKHIDQALMRLRDGGRLVAILGKGMNNADYYQYWDKLRQTYNIRANLSIDGNNYKKYGTTWGVQIVVIDKTGPQTGETVTGKYTDLTEVPSVLEGIRNDRSNMEKGSPASNGNPVSESVADGGNAGNSDTGHSGSSERTAGSASQSKRKKNRKVADATQGAADRTHGAAVAETVREAAGSQDGGTDRTAGRTDTGDGADADGSGASYQHESELPKQGLTEPEEVSDDGVYATFVLPDIPVKGSRKHPAVLVESAAMAAVSMPKATYVPKLPAEVVKNNLSDAQMVTVTYAGQAHEQKLPDGRRKGFFIGDGTGVGKGRQIAGIILDNFMQGRDKAVWISKNDDLYGDAVRDWTQTTGRSKEEVVSQGKFKPKDSITMKSGILFTSYGKLKMEKGGNRLDQIVQWVGKDFDGVIAFDEAHFMGNLFGKKGKFGKAKGSLTAKAGVELQRKLPNARIVYVSATAATEVDNLAYAERLGLWGQGTAFNNAQDFIAKIGSSGLAAMELVIRDMKAMGSYVARSISYNGVNYDTVEHTLDPMQVQIYDTMSRAWQKTMSNVQSALVTTGGKYNSAERQRAMGNFYSSMQRFYNQVLTSMAMPSVIADMRKELAAGHSCVMQIVNTNEAQQNKQLAEAKAKGESLDNLDMTPREALIGYLNTSFPTQLFEEYTDEDGNLRSRPVLDSKGNPVQSKEAIRQRDALIAEVNQMSIPDGPLEMLFDAFGPEAVAENTGRSRRVVPKKQEDGSITRVEERRSLNHRTADVQAFQDGKKRILVFSDAGGTGKSYHADRSEKNQQLRIHYVLQPGWVASNAVQGFGRTHRSNEVTPPVYKLVTTNIKGQKRFTSTIARRLDQLGALTKGQRDTGSGMFGAKDNLETDLAKDSLREFYKRLGKNQIEGIDGMKTLDRLGLKQKFTDEYGAFKLNDTLARDISTFLNRILSLEVDEQNTVFDAFISIYEMELEAAIQAGTLDTGMENVKADKIEVVDDKVIREDKNSGAATHYIQAKTYTKPKIITTVAEMAVLRSGFEGLYKTESGAVKAVFRIADKTTEWGAIQKQYRLVGPNQGAKNSVWGEATLNNKAKAIEKAEWQKEWDAEVAKVPEYNEDTLHMLTGALLPIWNSLPQEGSTKVKRLIAEDGSAYLGRVISKDMIDGVLRSFAIGRTMEVFTGQQVMDKAIKNGVRFQLTNDRVQIYRSRVSGEWRLEVFQPYNSWYLTRRYPGIIQERISYRDRFFIPVGEKGIPILDKLLQDNPVRSTMEDVEEFRQRTNTLTDREALAIAADELSMDGMSEAERSALTIFRDRLAKLDDLQDQRAELGRQYKEQQFGANVDRAAAAETLDKMHAMDARIQAANAKVLDVEEKTVLRDVLKKARKVVEQKQKEHDDEILKRWRDRRNNAAAIKKYRQRIQKDVNTITDWALKPSGKDILKHIPDALKETVLPFLTSIDFTSKRQLDGGAATQADRAFVERLENLRSILTPNMDTEQLYSEYDLPPNFLKRLDTFIKAAQSLTGSNDGTYLINKMTSEELKNLADIVSNLKVLIANVNKFHANAMFQHVHEAGDSTISTLAAMKPDSGKHSGMKNFLFWEQIRPAYAFERFGEGGKAIYDGLRRGQAQLAFNANRIIEFADKAYSESEVKKWGSEVQEIELENGSTIQLTTAAMMSFYELSKRKQALQHMLGGGVRAASFKQKGKTVSDEGHLITLSDVDRIVGALTPRQKEVADNIQKFMEDQGGAWGNHVSMKRFGEKLFGEEHYFPINSDGRHLQATADEKGGVGLYSLLNMGFTKQLTEGAKNRIILYNIFDVFANHMASMAQYHAMALPVLDAVKWFNYQQKGEVQEQVNGKTVVRMEVEDSVRDQLARVFGSFEETRIGSGKKSFAEKFILNILRGYNGTEAQGSPMDSIGLKSLHTYNRAQVAYNLRVVIQQPLAVTRAAMLIDYASIIRGMKLNPAAVQKNIQEMQHYSGIAAWKALGFYDVNISRGLTSLIKHDEKVSDKITEVGMWGAEKADQLTWAGIWSACKAEVIRKQHISSKDTNFYEAVTKLFEDVIYKTQVVDSILTKNEFMRDKGYLARAVGSFMSESTTTASMLMNAYDQYHMDVQRGLSRQQAWKQNRRMIGRTVYVYGLGAVILAAAQAVADAFRDDDDYQEYDEKWAEAFGENLLEELIPFNKLPLVGDLWEVGKELLATFTGLDLYGNAPQSVIMQWYDSLVKGVEILHDKMAGEDTNYTWYAGAYKLLQAVSGITGLPMAAATREIVTGWNNIVGAMAPSLKVKTYDAGPENNVKFAYKDRYLTAEEATAELIAKGIVDNENEAYWKIQQWGDPDGEYSRYDAINQAVRSGANISAEMEELTSHGYTEKDVLSTIKGNIGTWYRDGEITKQQAINMLRKYIGLSSEEITSTVNKWSSKVVTGIAFEDIKEQFMTGKLTQSKAVDMYVRYGGYTRDRAMEIVAEWKYEKDYPNSDISFSDYRKWETNGRSRGVSLEVYTDVAKFRDDGTSESVKDQETVANYINRLPISTAQKDALWCCFWKESTLNKAPWH